MIGMIGGGMNPPGGLPSPGVPGAAGGIKGSPGDGG